MAVVPRLFDLNWQLLFKTWQAIWCAKILWLLILATFVFSVRVCRHAKSIRLVCMTVFLELADKHSNFIL